MDDLSKSVVEIYLKMREKGQITLAVDKLPYTEEFEALYERVEKRHRGADRATVYRKLVNMRKQAHCRTGPRPKKDRLSLNQARILKTIGAHPQGLSRLDISRKADVPYNMNGTLGPVYTDDIGAEERKRDCKTLLGLGLVYAEMEDRDGTGMAPYYYLSPEGKAAYARLLKASS